METREEGFGNNFEMVERKLGGIYRERGDWLLMEIAWKGSKIREKGRGRGRWVKGRFVVC